MHVYRLLVSCMPLRASSGRSKQGDVTYIGAAGGKLAVAWYAAALFGRCMHMHEELRRVDMDQWREQQWRACITHAWRGDLTDATAPRRWQCRPRGESVQCSAVGRFPGIGPASCRGRESENPCIASSLSGAADASVRDEGGTVHCLSSAMHGRAQMQSKDEQLHAGAARAVYRATYVSGIPATAPAPAI